jgi:hypothetical protein
MLYWADPDGMVVALPDGMTDSTTTTRSHTMTTTTYYAIDDGHGNALTTGLAPEVARKTAQRMANERGSAVYLYEVPGSGADDESEEFLPETDQPA